MSGIRVGTCSWTDPTMVRAWYPPSARTAADRLRYYAGHFDTVEVDSSYYGMPTPATARLWAERTPPGFVFHIKAFGICVIPDSAIGRLDCLGDDLLQRCAKLLLNGW